MSAPTRRHQAYRARVKAAQIACARPHPVHIVSGDESRYLLPDGTPSYIASFTKGLPHDVHTGLLVNPPDYKLFIRATNHPIPRKIRAIPLGPVSGKFQSEIAKHAKVRAWESMGAGLNFDLEGPDAQAVTISKVPRLDSDELAYEIAEVYWMSLLRDVNLGYFSEVGREVLGKDKDVEKSIGQAIDSLNAMRWVRRSGRGLNEEEKSRKRSKLGIQSVFRGILKGDDVGPYMSQFLLMGTESVDGGGDLKDGFVQYGAMRMDQKVRVATIGKDYMTNWKQFVDVQNGADLRGKESYDSQVAYRFITSARDLCTYVHLDALYQAYLNACLIMLNMGVPFDEGIPFQEEDVIDKQQGFAQWGGPHILTLLTEVATRALKAVRYQKFNVHRRMRPERLAGILDRYEKGEKGVIEEVARPVIEALDENMLSKVREWNREQNERWSDGGKKRRRDVKDGNDFLLLPMAFAEGSPMHPSYGSGHATVGGACITILKAWFKTDYKLKTCLVANEDGSKLVTAKCHGLTVEGELNKLCSNIAVGRNWAGVHWFSDYYESVLLGEQVALGILEEQMLTYSERVSMTVPLFNGKVRKFSTRGLGSHGSHSTYTSH